MKHRSIFYTMVSYLKENSHSIISLGDWIRVFWPHPDFDCKFIGRKVSITTNDAFFEKLDL